MRLQYVGSKVNGENAFKDETRITWYPGDENDVHDSIAERMVKHPDVFVRVGSAEHDAVKSRPEADQPGSWQARAMTLGMTDGNIEAIEPNGGPTTVKGAALWESYCGEPHEGAPKVMTLAQAPAAPTRVGASGAAVTDQDVDDEADREAAEAKQAAQPGSLDGAALVTDGLKADQITAGSVDAQAAQPEATTPTPTAKQAPAKKAAAKTTAKSGKKK